MTQTTTFLDTLPSIDWSDFERASVESQSVLARLARERDTLTALVEGIQGDALLLSMCERHDVLDKLVLYDALDRGFRIRIHIASSTPAERIHAHRFSFSSLIMYGSYVHKFYTSLDPSGTDLRNFQLIHVSTERDGSLYTMHHSVHHTTLMSDGMVSLIIRGTSEKKRAIIVDRDTGEHAYRVTDAQESEQHRRNVRMSVDILSEDIGKLRQLGIINNTSASQTCHD